MEAWLCCPGRCGVMIIEFGGALEENGKGHVGVVHG